MAAVPSLKKVLLPFGRIFRDAGRLLAAHWPQLVGLFLAGWAARMGVLWLVVNVSATSATAAVLLLPLAPLATLLSMILMLRAVADSLPAFAGVFTVTSLPQRWRADLTAAAFVMLPFLALYASQGLLRDDSQAFLWDAKADVLLNESNWNLAARSDYASLPVLIGMVAGALVVRKVLTALELPKKSIGWSLVATYVEVLWLVTLAASLAGLLSDLRDWVASRQAIAPLIETWNQFAGAATEIAIVKTALDGMGTVVASVGDMVIIPVAWLAIGASVYSAKLAGREFQGHEAMTKRLASVPSPVRRAVVQVIEPVTTPVKDALTAVGKIAAAGVVPMIMFSVVFVLAAQLKVGVAWAFRQALGPREPFELYALEPYSLMAQRLVYFVVAMALVASAVNAIVIAQQEGEAPAADTATNGDEAIGLVVQPGTENTA